MNYPLTLTRYKYPDMAKYFNSKTLSLFTGMLLFCGVAFGQTYAGLGKKIDSLGKLNLPKSALVQVDKLEQLARKQNKPAQQVKAVIYRMQFQSAIEENTLVAIIGRLKQDIAKAKYPVKPVLQSLLGGIYWSYYHQNRWQFNQRTRVETTDDDFTKWDLQTINNQMAITFKQSLADYKQEQQTPITILDGVLTGDKANRYLRPTLYDLLVQRALDFFTEEEPALTRPKLPFTLTDARLFGDSRTFATLNIITIDTTSTFYQATQYLKQATLFHLDRHDEEALADLDLQRLDFMYRASPMPGKDKLYLDALTQIANTTTFKAISADALVLSGKYYYDKDSLKLAYTYFDKVMANYPQSFGAVNAKGYLKDIEQQQLSAQVEDVNVPNKPLLGLLNYRNIKAARLIIYKVSTRQFNQLAAIPSDINRYNNGVNIYPSDSVFRYLKKLQPVQNITIPITGEQDFRAHSAEFKINALPSGHYIIISRNDAGTDASQVGLTTFKICNLAYATRRNADGQVELRVLNRETGVPVAGVQVTISEALPKTTDANGVCLFYATENFSVKLTKGADTLYTPGRYVYNVLTSEPSQYNTVLFTDRQIYRPGQTVYYKGLQLSIQNGKSSIQAKTTVSIAIIDNNGKNVTTLQHTTNSYGTFAGSFTIPQNILNGYVRMVAADGSKYIRVEDYKRPSFQVEFSPVKGSYKPNDMVTVSGQVKAYSGYGLSQARVVYHITRSAEQRQYMYYRSFYFGELPPENEIVVDTLKTDDNGKFNIKFKAIPAEGISLEGINYLYAISADVTDGSGETRSANTSVKVGVNNLDIDASIPGELRATDSITAKITNLNGVTQGGTLKLKIYALTEPDGLPKERLWGWQKADTWLMSKAEYKKEFPEYGYENEWNEMLYPTKAQVADVSLTTTDTTAGVFKLNMLANQPTGTYRVIIHAQNKVGDTTTSVRYLYLMNQSSKPHTMDDWVTQVNTSVKPGTQAVFLVGTGKANTVLMEKYSGKQILSAQWLNIPEGKQQQVSVPIGTDEQNVTVQFLMAYQNRLYSSYKKINIQVPDEHLDMKFLTFRDKLQPGDKEQWKIQITAKDKAAEAEMLANLYDASLDDIATADMWSIHLNRFNNYAPHYFNWDGTAIANQAETTPLKNPVYYNFSLNYRQYEMLNMLGFVNNGVYKALRGRAFGVSSGYLAEASISAPNQLPLNGKASFATDTSTFVRKSEGGAVKKLLGDIVPGMQVTDDYGDQANLTGIKDGSAQQVLKPIALRTNFNETAFFYPQLLTNAKGEVLIEFTIPQSLTKWKFRAFAHTQQFNTGYIEREVVTQKQLSITANMPRFLREGDTITVSARLANLTPTALTGKVNLTLLNAITMQPVNILLNPANAQQSFNIGASSTKAVSFKMVIPFGVDALTYRLTADAGTFTDGEENTLPVIPNRMLVTESMPMMVLGGQTKAFTFDKLINQSSTTLKNKNLTLEYTQNPAWYAVQALPYMMEFPYECSEQIFSRYYANSLGTNLVNKMPVIKQVFDQWKATNSNELLSNLEKNQELKATLIEETPWLRDAVNESEQKKRVALLFDMNKMSYELQTNLQKLADRQLADGGFPWFGGNSTDAYITRHILAGVGQLYKLGIADANNQTLKAIADKAIDYVENRLMSDAAWQKKQKTYDTRLIGQDEIHAYYAISYFDKANLSDLMKQLLANYLSHAEKEWTSHSVYDQGLIALTMLRNNRPQSAKPIIASLIENAQQTDDMGMYWAKNQRGYFWYQAPVETQCLMVELFTEAGNHDKEVEEMKIWLLRNKQTNNWQTTKATAAACYALLLKGNNWLADNGTSVIKLGNKNLTELKPDVKPDAGTGYIKTAWTDEQIKPNLGKVSITNNGQTVSWGALHWQYLENLDKITSSATDIHLERKYFIQKTSDTGPVLVAVDAAHQPKVGDLLKVVVYLKAGRDFEYVQLKDMRPAGTEPVDALSNYKYQDGLYYYQVTKDVATNFFISYLNKGNYVFEYRLRVAQPGNFSTGISTLQCMYAPEFNAHSQGSRMSIGQ
ncbi:MG2 domain-containing protein [Mucilaginibacter gracilis]|uniref:MG2 domain-containing protein n=1 Tax=Mucilaginibacter gracilis TaxID=423350 RepID=A0A495J3A0_9SPHI|nr:alpha-2-macroglobulin family protein [Mucilaginibacter gracilis]RKR82489.1 MG2 domain-containing protein [Mucilaginibacter gracilis]